jgi:competence protein ComEA
MPDSANLHRAAYVVAALLVVAAALWYAHRARAPAAAVPLRLPAGAGASAGTSPTGPTAPMVETIAPPTEGPGASPRGAGPPAGAGERPSDAVTTSAGVSPQILVDVAGAVRRPGVVRLGADARAAEAIRYAGGLRPDADRSAVNFAAPLADGEQLRVPTRGDGAASGGTASVGSSSPASGAAPSGSGDPGPGRPVHLNTADATVLDGLDGVGPVTAQRIIEYRDAHGGFRSVEELGEVPGIGPVRLERLRTQVTVP